MARITVRQDTRAGLATVYNDGVQVAIMERAPYSGTWMYNPSPPDNFRPRFYSTGFTSVHDAARVAAGLRKPKNAIS